jgi:hypothetical protein
MADLGAEVAQSLTKDRSREQWSRLLRILTLRQAHDRWTGFSNMVGGKNFQSCSGDSATRDNEACGATAQ